MGRRLAFLIGNQSFGPNSGLDPLSGPLNDVAAMKAVLADPARGGCEVQHFADGRREDILPALEEALNGTGPGDMMLLFYAGHGKLDPAGRLCLATAETRASALYSTSMPAAELRNLIANARCDQVVLLLDCCYSGAAGREFSRGGVDDQLALMREAQGLHVLTASTGFQTARELEGADAGKVMGRFTRAITEGLTSGRADCDRDGQVSLSDLRRYLAETIRGQTPQYWAQDAAGDPVIARAGPVETPAQKRARRLGAWFAEGRIPEGDYPALSAAAAGQGDARLAALVARMLDNPQMSAEALMGAWHGATSPPEERPAEPRQFRETRQAEPPRLETPRAETSRAEAPRATPPEAPASLWARYWRWSTNPPAGSWRDGLRWRKGDYIGYFVTLFFFYAVLALDAQPHDPDPVQVVSVAIWLGCVWSSVKFCRWLWRRLSGSGTKATP